jgi:serine beta-lactamase-like protein LACTB, mitochondrial
MAFRSHFLLVVVAGAVVGACPPRAMAVPSAPVAASASAEARPASALREARAETVLREYAAKHRVPGISVAVGVGGEVSWVFVSGVAGLETGPAVTPESVFPLGSTSKVITSLAVGRLVDEGRLDLDAPIQRYVPSFPPKGPAARPITARLLGGHLAGLRDYDMAAGEYANTRAFPTVDAAVAVFRGDPLLHPPGERFAYSAYNFVLLSAAIEGASKSDFLSFVKEAITAPLGLDRTGPDLSGAPAPGRVDGHVRGFFGAIAKAGPLDVSSKWAAGGFVSTPTELVRLGNAVLAGRVVRPETFALLTTPQRQADGSESPGGYALGFRSGRAKLPATGREVRVVHHGGVANGAVSFFAILPDERLVVGVQANLQVQPFDLHEPAYALAELFLEAGSGAGGLSSAR